MANEKTTRVNEIARKYGDPWIWGIYIMLVIISIVESYSASSREIASQGVYMPLIKQVVLLVLGFGIVFALVRTEYNRSRFLLIMIPGLTILTVLSLLYVMFFGVVINDAARAINLPLGFTFQPAELAKLSIVTLLSYVLAKSQKDHDVSVRGMIIAGVAVAVYGGLMIKGGLTNTLLLMVISLSMLLIGGASFKKIVFLLLFYAFFGGAFYALKNYNDQKDENLMVVQQERRAVNEDGDSVVVLVNEDNAKGGSSGLRNKTWASRVKAWWNSDSLVYRPLNNKNQQEMFSRMAQAHGGIYGVGIGQSRECSRLPLAFSDYIYSIIVEETGLLGGLFVLLLYLWLLARSAMIVQRSRRVLPSLLIIGTASLVTFQALFHMAINVGVFPVSGQPLPLISKGGTSILVMSAAFGIMLTVSRTIANYNNKNNKVEETRLPEGLDAENPTQIVPKNVWK